MGPNGYIEKFHMTGDRALLDEGLALQRHAITSPDVDDVERANRLGGLASLLEVLHTVTGRVGLLDEAISSERRAVSLLEAASEADEPAGEARQLTCLSGLGGLLTKRYERYGDVEALKEAGPLAIRVMKTPVDIPLLADHLSFVAATIRRLGEVRDDNEMLEQAVVFQRHAVETTGADAIARPSRVRYLAELLLELSDMTGEAGPLDEAWALVEHLRPDSPFDQVDLAMTRARLARRDRRRRDAFAVAAGELTTAVGVVDRLRRAERHPTRRRDLAQRYDGLLGELVANTALSGNLDRAIELIEAERVWLPAPPDGAVALASTSPLSIPVAWVVSSSSETVVITSVDHRTYTMHVIETTRRALYQGVVANARTQMQPAEASPNEQERHLAAAQRQTVEDLCSLATNIAAVFPPVEHLLVVPVGICALLPYAAARRDDGFLTDQTTLTIAPSLAWARAAYRRRSSGPSFGAFHPGTGSDTPLRLDDDRRVFEELVGGTVLDRPSAKDVLARLDGADIAHIHCHGSYDGEDPFESTLHLETDLTISDVQGQPSAPWLVNLAACWTAICDLGATEQHISLATAFLLPGAAHVLANLWATTTPHSTLFNAVFYQHLASGAHPAVARRHAVRQLRDALAKQTGVDVHPLFWAPFTHFGSPW
jgi:hypothetical protein